MTYRITRNADAIQTAAEALMRLGIELDDAGLHEWAAQAFQVHGLLFVEVGE